MKGKLTIVGKITAKTDKIDFIKEELVKLIDTTRAEEGCIQYDLHQDNDHPEIFLFFENWENRELWQKHMNNDHLKNYIKVTEGCVADFTLNEMSFVK